MSDLEADARELLAGEVYDYFAGGADDEHTLIDSVEAWRRFRFVPRVLRDVSNVDVTTTLLGREVTAPIGVAPVGYQGLLHEQADVGTAIGAARAGLVFTASTRGTVMPLVIAADAPEGPRWFQTYVLRDRDHTLDLAVEAAKASFDAIVLTADMPVLARRLRDVRNGFTLPPSISSQARVGLPAAQTGALAQDPALTFDAIAWLNDATGLPVVVKGVLHPDDAVRCLDAGASAIWVSAHGGRQLDGCIAPADALAPVVEAVGDRAEVYVDGGIRRGADVLRALALGARAAFVGRPAMWGLAVAGDQGVEQVLAELIEELRLALALTGNVSVADVGRDLLSPR